MHTGALKNWKKKYFLTNNIAGQLSEIPLKGNNNFRVAF